MERMVDRFDESLQDKVSGALAGSWIVDALAMPVHWLYDRGALRRDYGTVTDFVAHRMDGKTAGTELPPPPAWP